MKDSPQVESKSVLHEFDILKSLKLQIYWIKSIYCDILNSELTVTNVLSFFVFFFLNNQISFHLTLGEFGESLMEDIA